MGKKTNSIESKQYFFVMNAKINRTHILYEELKVFHKEFNKNKQWKPVAFGVLFLFFFGKQLIIIPRGEHISCHRFKEKREREEKKRSKSDYRHGWGNGNMNTKCTNTRSQYE